MKKDVVYIDIEDDITAIINKLKASSEKVVALVPPKRTGVLQSAVNLRLLARTSKQKKVHLVIITNDHALQQLAASAEILTARNLQSKPEMAEIPALAVDDEDIIDGDTLPVGEHAASQGEDDKKEAELIKGVDINDTPKPSATSGKKKSSSKVPNFNSFRKKLVLVIALLFILVGGLVWAIFFAPAATITLTAKTRPVSVSETVRLGDATDAERKTLSVKTQGSKKDLSIDFPATGEKDVGEKAKGTVRLSAPATRDIGRSVEAGTELTTSSGKVFVTDTSVTMDISNWGGVDVTVTAKESGESYNAASGRLSGAPGDISARLVDATSGGTTKVVAVVTAADVQKAKEKLVRQPTDDVEKSLAQEFDNTDKVIEGSFRTDYGKVSADPSVGDTAKSGKATLDVAAEYKLSAVPENDIKKYLEESFKQQMEDQTAQKIYGNSGDTIKLTDYKKDTVHIEASGQIGPEIDENNIKDRVAGKRFGDIREDLESSINGVNGVDVDFSYFWVRTVPKNPDRITVKYDVQETRG